MIDKYKERIHDYELQLQKHEKNHNILGYVKLGSVALFLFCGYQFLNKYDFFYFLFAFLFLELTILFFIIHGKVDEKRNYYSKMCEIYTQYTCRIEGGWTDFEDTGYEFLGIDHPYSNDLDLLGKNSLFQKICSAGTWHGRKQFARELLNLMPEKGYIEKRQNAVQELSKDLRFNTDFQYHTSKISKGEKNSVNDLIELVSDQEAFKTSVFLRILAVCLPVISILFMVTGKILKLEGLLYTGIGIVALQFVLWAAGGLKLSHSIGRISGARYQISGYIKIFQIVEEADFNAKLLKEIKADFTLNGTKASKAIKELNQAIEMINMRNNVILYVVLNVFFLWDYRCADKVIKWQMKYAEEMEKPFIAAGKLESLFCFSNIKHIEEYAVIADINEESKINAQELGHPLILKDRRISNSFTLNDEIFIVSGSNMSGKTTFLRTVGVNMVLALNGGFVCAESFSFPLVHIATSMRIVDDLNQGVSTFYAELSKIKNIVDKSKEDKRILFLIDEIFRGTNSRDRLEGAENVLSKLSALGAIGLITTHDLELCEIADSRIQNYSFSEHYLEDEIYFDYKLKKGISNSTNAKFLMKKLGLI